MMRLLEIFEKTPKIKTKRVKKSTCSDEKAKITANDDPCNGLSSALQLIPQSGRRFTGDQGLAAGGCTEAEDATFPLLRYPSPSSHKLEIDRGEGSGIKHSRSLGSQLLSSWLPSQRQSQHLPLKVLLQRAAQFRSVCSRFCEQG